MQQCDDAKPSGGRDPSPKRGLEDYDAIFMTGSPLHLYEDTPDTRKQVELMRAIFGSGTPSFGSCAGLQVATVAAGGTVRANPCGREVAFARRLTPTEAGAKHPLLRGRPQVYEAPAFHTDEVETLPGGAMLLASNRVSEVQAAEIRCGEGVFWGVQYHPELSLVEIAAALRRQSDDLIDEGLALDREGIDNQAELIEALGRTPTRRDLAWRLGLDEEVTHPRRRTAELRNFVEHLVRPTSRCGDGRE